jgi:hypothetical protein
MSWDRCKEFSPYPIGRAILSPERTAVSIWLDGVEKRVGEEPMYRCRHPLKPSCLAWTFMCLLFLRAET